jgi:hypothetical protein
MQPRELDDVCGPVWDDGVAFTGLKPKAVTVFVDYPFIFERVNPVFAGFCLTLFQDTRYRIVYGMDHSIPSLLEIAALG